MGVTVRAAVLALPLVLAVPSVARAYLDTFDARACAWRATDIVVASAEKLDGTVRVLESWRGHLAKGSELRLPELSELASEPLREIIDPETWPGPPVAPRPHVTGRRVVLFLVKAGFTLDEGPGAGVYRGASPNGGLKTSIAWIESATTHATIRFANWRPQVMLALGPEAELEELVARYGTVRRTFDEAVATSDSEARARALEPFLGHTIDEARWAAFEEIPRAGAAAVPVLRRTMDAHEGSERMAEIDALASIGEPAGPEIHALLQRELAFWQERAPLLDESWITQGKDRHLLLTHFGDLESLLRAVERARFRECEATVVAVRDLARRTVKWDGIDWVCGQTLDALRASPSLAK